MSAPAAGPNPAPLPAVLAAALGKLPHGSLVAIDGRCAAGKTTLAGQLAEIYPDSLVLHMDDFYVPAAQKTPQRMAVPGNNVDWERFLEQVLTPLAQGKPFLYQPFSCHSQQLGQAQVQTPRALNIVEGSYSCHPALRNFYALRIFLDVDASEQLRRIRQRNGAQGLAVFREQWIPLEERYFSACGVRQCCQLCLP